MIQQERSQRVEFERSVQSDTDRRAQANKQKYSNDLQKLMDSIKVTVYSIPSPRNKYLLGLCEAILKF